jgi:hypothetical protein
MLSVAAVRSGTILMDLLVSFNILACVERQHPTHLTLKDQKQLLGSVVDLWKRSSLKK